MVNAPTGGTEVPRVAVRQAVMANAAIVLGLGLALDFAFGGATALGDGFSTLLVLLPFAGVAAWRTWHYAVRWRSGPAPLRPMFEPVMVAVVILAVVLGPGTLSRPQDAPAYWLVYGIPALAAALFLGFLLRQVALTILAVHGPRRSADDLA
ncbi:MAG: hypothetical protein R2882_02690 [Gemmatimonadales bacterium]